MALLAPEGRLYGGFDSQLWPLGDNVVEAIASVLHPDSSKTWDIRASLQ